MPNFHLVFRSPLSFAAAASVALLVVAIGFKLELSRLSFAADEPAPVIAQATSTEPQGATWQQEMVLLGLATSSEAGAGTSTDPVGMIGPVVLGKLMGEYAGLVESQSYSQDALQQAAASIAPNVKAVVPYQTYTLDDLTTDTDTSYARMLTYRSDLRAALAPLLDNKNSELEMYAKYVETSDPTYLGKLAAAAANYRLAASSTAKVVVPRDAVNYHLDILNAMEKFAATLDSMSKHGDDSIGSVALLRTYNDAEQRMYTSFNALSDYYGQKTP